jgi:hypothetical protein
MISSFRSIHNFIDKLSDSENEDSISISENEDFDLFAVSDGAGGAGIYCGEWARFITSNQPEIPFFSKDEADAWFINLSKDFYQKYYPKVDKSDVYIREKFLKEGSYATILYCWISKRDRKLFYTAVGDTSLFIFSKTSSGMMPALIFPINEQMNLHDSPDLINWRRDLNFNLVSKEYLLEKDDIVILCTDSIARLLVYHLLVLDQKNTFKALGDRITKSIDQNMLEYLHKRYSFIETMTSLLGQLKKLVKLQDYNFQKVLSTLVHRGELDKDDFSIVIIEAK